MSAYLASTVTNGGLPMNKSDLYPSQTGLLPVQRPGGKEGLVGLSGKSEPGTRCRGRAITATSDCPHATADIGDRCAEP